MTTARARTDPRDTRSAEGVRRIHRRLTTRFGPLDPGRRLEPLDELVLTILSQNTSDVNSSRAYQALQERYPTWGALSAADPEELARTIRSGGLANIKAPRILAILGEIERRQGDLDLSWMTTASSDRVRKFLISLPGVGPKTAACVLAFSLGRPVIPVDTHVHRVARRLGWLDARTNVVAAHEVLEALVPPKVRVPVHVGLIRLGRAICRAGRPSCEICPLQDLCPTAPTVLGRPARTAKVATRP